MKSLKNPLLLLLVWIISIFCLCLSFMFYSKEALNFEKLFGGTLVLIFYSAIFSFPAFLFFFLISYFTLRSERLNPAKKKMIMLSANLTDIVITFGAVFMLFSSNTIEHDAARSMRALKDIATFYPLWVLVIVSSLLIVTLPFNFNKSKI